LCCATYRVSRTFTYLQVLSFGGCVVGSSGDPACDSVLIMFDLKCKHASFLRLGTLQETHVIQS
jgi:hypothetical protein